MIIFCTFRFKETLEKLSKNNSYSAILEDICNYFRDKDIKELHITKDIIQNSSNIYSLNKYRIMNSQFNKGKSGSYRCICGCYLRGDLIILDTIYPKTGSEEIDNLSKEAYKEIAQNIKSSLSKGKVFILDITTKRFLTNK
jgi:hypothetical protein